MRFKQYINENQDFYTKLRNGIKTVYTHCKPYIKDVCKSGFNYITNGDTLLYSAEKIIKISL